MRMNLAGKYDRFRDFARVLDRVQIEFLDKTFTAGYLQKDLRRDGTASTSVWFEGFDVKTQDFEQTQH